ncbi:MAG: transcriptional regulator [Candidatus Heimdallarchaeota archaeon]
MEPEFLSRRERVFRILRESQEGITPEEIARILNIRDLKVIYEDLASIAKSIKAKNRRERLGMIPPICRVCGFVFDAKKPKKPSKCPNCRSERINSPRFSIISGFTKKSIKS